MKRIVVFFIMLFTAAPLMAGFQVGSISQILAHDNGNGVEIVIVNLDGTSTSMEWCSSREDWALVLDGELAKAQFSMLLSTYMAEKSIHIDSDTGKNCINGRNRIRNIRLR